MSARTKPFFLSLGTVTGEKVPVTINGDPVEFDAPGFKGGLLRAFHRLFNGESDSHLESSRKKDPQLESFPIHQSKIYIGSCTLISILVILSHEKIAIKATAGLLRSVPCDS